MVGSRIALRARDTRPRQPRRYRRACKRRCDRSGRPLAGRGERGLQRAADPRGARRRRRGRARMGAAHAGIAAARQATPSESEELPIFRERGCASRSASRTPAAIGCSVILLAKAGLDADALDDVGRPAHAETELAAFMRDGHADVGLGIEAAARANGLAFVRWPRSAWISSRFAATRSSRRCKRCSHGRAHPSSSRRHASSADTTSPIPAASYSTRRGVGRSFALVRDVSGEPLTCAATPDYWVSSRFSASC